MLRVEPRTVRDLYRQRKCRSEMRIDAARALGLARCKTQEPAIVKQLPLRLPRVEAGLFAARSAAPRRSRAHRGSRGHFHNRSHTAKTSSVYPAARMSSPITPKPLWYLASNWRIGGGLTMSNTRNS